MTSATFDTTTADVLAHAPVGVLLLDERGVVVRANDAAARLLRSTVERLAGEHVLDVARPLDGSLLKRLGINLGRHRAAAMARLAEGPVMVHARGVRGGAELTVTAYGPDAQIRHVAWLREQAPAPAAEPPRGASVDQLASFADADATVVCSVDADGMLTAVSGAALTAAGVCCEEAVGEHLGTGLAPVPVLANLLRRANRGIASDDAVNLGPATIRLTVRPVPGGGAAALGYDLSEQQAAEARVRLLEHNDALTGLPNRRSVTEVLDDAADRAQRNAAVALLRVRFDDLDVAAGALGVAAADGLLAETAERIRAAAPERAFVARGDGPELMVVLTGLPRDGRAAAEEVAQSLLGALVTPTVAGGRPIRLAPAIGGALAPRDGTTAADLLRAAASAQLRAREDGPGEIALEAGEPGPAQDRLLLSAPLAEAIERGELHIHFQPILWLANSVPYGVEALLRWDHPSLGTVSPGRFIPVAESTGLIDPLSDWLMQELCTQATRWRERNVFPQIHFNAAPQQLEGPAFAARMDETITRHGLAAAGFTMELTESSRLSGRGEAALEDVRRMGMKIALDDFGEGADSFARVKDIPAHVLKLDRALLRDVPQRPEANAIVASVLALAKALGMQAIAEGIENDGHRTFLIEQRCPLGQGYRLGRPLPAPRVG